MAGIMCAVAPAVSGAGPQQADTALTVSIIPVLSSAEEQAAKDGEHVPPANIKLTPDEKLDALFVELRKTAHESKALRIAGEINSLWAQSGSATVDLMMGWANAAIVEKKYPVAIDFLDEVVALLPDYAEVWNRRATLHFLMKDYARAMVDIHQTLMLEPRHYGALTGMAAILQARGLKEPALRAYERALEVYPMMRPAQEKVQQLSDELTDTRI